MAKRNLINNGDGTCSVPLTRGMFALIDLEDAPLVSHRSWHARRARTGSGKWYAAAGTRDSSGTFRILLLHREIVHGAPEIDHINGDGLDCRKANLRKTDRLGNTKNVGVRKDSTTGAKGVSLRDGRWRARIQSDGTRRFLGSFSTRDEAVAAYNDAAIKHHREFARINEAV